jgi:hypothetical protein
MLTSLLVALPVDKTAKTKSRNRRKCPMSGLGLGLGLGLVFGFGFGFWFGFGFGSGGGLYLRECNRRDKARRMPQGVYFSHPLSSSPR